MPVHTGPMPKDPAGAEVMELGRDRRMSSRTRRALVAVLVVVAVLGAGAWLADTRVRDGDERAVAACRDAATQADVRASSVVGFMVQYVEPSLYAVPEGPRRDGLVALVADAASRALPSVRAALDRCRGTAVRWWHLDLADRRAAYVDYLDARVQRLEEVAADGHAYYHDQPRLAELRARAFDPA